MIFDTLFTLGAVALFSVTHALFFIAGAVSRGRRDGGRSSFPERESDGWEAILSWDPKRKEGGYDEAEKRR